VAVHHFDDVSIQEDDKNEPDQRQNLAELHKAIMQLEKEYRDPLMLQVVGGFSGKEIAEILDLNNNTVMTRLFRARSKLRAILDPEAIADESGQASQEELC
jgi:RNA polymerase sigma-70 factor, ECF subfamily